MLKSLKRKVVIGAMLLSPITFTSCTEDSDVLSAIIELLLSMLGWNPDDEHIENQEDAVVYDDDEVDGLDRSVDLSRYFPPIGNQGSYGTCVAWSTGYALKTACDAKTKKYTSSQLSMPAYQASPIDLWYEIEGKSYNCNGANFEPALKALMKNGVCSMDQRPFTNQKMTCDGVTAKGGSLKLKGYRVIAYSSEMTNGSSQGMNLGNFKYYLSKGYPILIGAQLGEHFMEWNSNKVITSDTKDYNGQHAYHAMVVTGYDDTKQAFRVRNSWGESQWGDNGCIWVGYNFFLNQFIFGAWIAYNEDQVPSDNTTSSAKVKSASANDLVAHVYSDVENEDGTRTLTYNVENSGSSTISSDKDWSVVYMIYNAKNINEKAILFQDVYSSNASSDGGAYKDGVAVFSSENYATNVNLPSSSSVAQQLGGKKMQFNYRLPETINGKPLDGNYYMVMIVNPFNSFEEKSFDNNYSFVSGANKIPLIIKNGKITNMPSTLSDVRDLTSNVNVNTYTGSEMVQMLARQFANGKLKKQVQSEPKVLRSAKKVKTVVK